MPDKHLSYCYPTSVSKGLVLGSLFWGPGFSQQLWLCNRNSTGDYVGLAACWGLGLS